MDTTLKVDVLPERILVVIPAYNEVPVEHVVTGVRAHQLPVLVVDDGSTDDTAVRAEAAGAVVLRHEENRGKGAALRTAFHWALEQDYDAVITLDADGQHDPAELPRFLAAYARGYYDLIIGARNFDDMPWSRYIMNMLGRWTFTWVMRQPMPDNQSGYRLLSQRLVRAALESDENGYEFEVDMIVICIERGYSLGWVPIRTIYNDHPSHINHVQHVAKYLRLIWQVRQRLKDAPPPRRDERVASPKT